MMIYFSIVLSFFVLLFSRVVTITCADKNTVQVPLVVSTNDDYDHARYARKEDDDDSSLFVLPSAMRARERSRDFVSVVVHACDVITNMGVRARRPSAPDRRVSRGSQPIDEAGRTKIKDENVEKQ